jgi:programmed cell death protein 5
MDDLDALRQKRLRELQERQESLAQEQETAVQAAQQQQSALESLLQQILEPEAFARFTNIRLSRPDFAATVSQQLATMAQSGRLQRRLTDGDFREVLAQLTPTSRDINITRK